MKGILLLTFCLLIADTAKCQTAASYLAEANKLYDAGKKEQAKRLYEQAAKLHSSEGHFALAYKYITTREDRIYHYSEAAKSGHSEATNQVLEELFFRSNSLTLTNPQLALDLYQQAKKTNPKLNIYDEEGRVATLKEAIEAGPFDIVAFIRKYNITAKDTSDEYSIWELAAMASRGKRFGRPDPNLILQLVYRGSSVPAEKMSAINDAFVNWQNNEVAEFDPCSYVTSGIGLAYCSEKASREAEREYLKTVKKLQGQLKNNAGALLPASYGAATHYIEKKGFLEEGHDGTGYTAWAQESIDSQKAAFLDLVRKINNGFRPKLNAHRDYDKELNGAFKQIMASLSAHPINTGFRDVTDKNVRAVQREWIKYRDSAAKLFSSIAPAVPEEDWKRFLTAVRIDDLNAIKKLAE